MATLILGGIGAGFGALIGGPGGARLGWSIGTVVGSWVEGQNAPSVERGKLDDLRFSGSTFGAAIPVVRGKGRVGGSVIWAATDAAGNHLVEHKRTSGGGGGSGGGGVKVTTYWYTSTFAVAFCAGAITFPDGTSVNRNATIKKIWADDVLLYVADAEENLVSPALYSGSESQVPDSTIVSEMGVLSANAPAFRGICYAVFSDMDLSDFSNRIPNFCAEIETNPITAGDVFSDIARMAGVAPADLHTSNGSDSVGGFLALNNATAQSYVEPVLFAYSLDLAEIDGQITLVKRGDASLLTVPEADLGAANESAEGSPAYEVERRLVTEMPGAVHVRYFDVNADYQQGLEIEVRQSETLPNQLTFNLPLCLAADDARAVAARELDRAWIEDHTVKITLGHKYLKLAPGDIITVPLDTGAERLRIVRATPGPVGEMRLELTPDSDDVLVQNFGGLGGGGGTGGADHPTVVATAFAVWSGREIVPAHEAAPGFYVAASGALGWRGCTVHFSLDGGETWLAGPAIVERSVFGQTVTSPPNIS